MLSPAVPGLEASTLAPSITLAPSDTLESPQGPRASVDSPVRQRQSMLMSLGSQNSQGKPNTGCAPEGTGRPYADF